ncbi:conserved hypothetical protein [Ricinus communis]|uniref:Uncharacterized protein n=1 Tax=Ricinus communis TaxID=3988 RepID=B9RAB5_RICCO|nr:conserved hypothetical protein [Ricinus communis]
MEDKRGMLGVVVVAAAMVAAVVVVFGGNVVEGAFSIQLNPCTLAQCITECKKALHEKYLSATCATGTQGKFCICLG